MNDYLNAKINLPTTGTSINNQTEGTMLSGDSSIYTQVNPASNRMIKVDDTPYVPSEKITVRKYRLFKTKGAQ